MVHSMTGYGKAVVELPHKKLTIEIKSLNSKQFDLFTRIPMIYREKEIGLRNYLSKKLERGKIDLSFTIEHISKDVSATIDHTLLKQYHQEIKSLAQELNIGMPQDWFQTLLRLPDVMKQDSEELNEEEWSIIEKTIEKAVNELISFRVQEGEMLENILAEKIANIRQLLQDVEPYESERIEKVKSRIYDGLATLENKEYDANRFEQEMIYYIEKLDVNEEKSRLTNHLDYFIETLGDPKSQGKKLGFIAQEMGREINTLGSKSNHSDMQRIVVRMKDELEQIKEQILNVL
ncbi:MAG TPA: YicC family protein [Petrimonas sp.]|uniref:YicC/YloC family endoribonuclease n=1 Tax=Petrimonas sp. TaxID=2023866 RepID=UPI00096860DA|nr:YicC/YloC family endoribonuclease [Petrimonas sp.]OJV36405.1 MAG: YicC family protein [Bacteroidia bacterium 43-41]MEA4948140.1 YicC/YloC family endoribonuclease [Petrimonas sp.]MEA4979155.1 YicC/YloC family endoribonuclease [Petrimonas sp.]MEA5046011.1 YicC/YloC family endoribonuclease [Petrimonas sp.]